MSVNIPVILSKVVLYLSLTADKCLPIIAFIKDDFPAFGAPTKAISIDFEPYGDLNKGISHYRASRGIKKPGSQISYAGGLY